MDRAELHSDSSGTIRRHRGLWVVPMLVLLALSGVAAWRWLTRPPALIPPHPLDPIVGVLASGESSRFNEPFGVAVAGDVVLATDAGPQAHGVYAVRPDGSVTTVAGAAPGYADGAGPQARFDTPSGMAVAPDGTIFVADTGNNVIRRISPDGRVSTFAGGRAPGDIDGRGGDARFNGPVGLCLLPDGRLVVADTYNDRIRAIAPDGAVTTIAGSLQGFGNGPARDARFDTPSGVATGASGDIYIADTGNNAVRLIARDGTVTSVAPLPDGGLSRPIGIAVTPDGLIYVSDERGRIVEMTPGVTARVLAGSQPGFADGAGSVARFRALGGIALAGSHRIMVADPRNGLIRVVRDRTDADLVPPSNPLLRPAFDEDTFGEEPLLWPSAPLEGPHEIAGTLGEARGGEGTERFHAGIDVRADEGEIVRTVRSGAVLSPASVMESGTLNESVRIGALAYVHVRVGRWRDGEPLPDPRFVTAYDETGRLVTVRARRGARFEAGEPIGSVNAFNHVHLNVGWPGEEVNPLHFRLMSFEDTVPPTIAPRGVWLFDAQGQRLTARRHGRLVVSGAVQIVVDAWDQVNGNLARRRLGLYRLGYQVLRSGGVPVEGFERPRETIVFDRLAPGHDAPRVVYAAGSGIPFYGRRTTHFLYVVTNTLRGGVASTSMWDTSRLDPGDYVLRILAADASGNEAVGNRDFSIIVER